MQVGSAYALDARRLDLPELPRVGDRAPARDAASTILSWWRGHPSGWWNPLDYNLASICVPIATHVPHAVGLAWGKKLRGEHDGRDRLLRRRRDLRGRVPRGRELRRRHQGAGDPLLQQQPLGDLDAALGADRGGDARRQGDRLRHAGRARGRRRRARGLRGDARGRGAGARRRRPDVHRGASPTAQRRTRPRTIPTRTSIPSGSRRRRRTSASAATSGYLRRAGRARRGEQVEAVRAEALERDARRDRRRRGRAARRLRARLRLRVRRSAAELARDARAAHPGGSS